MNIMGISVIYADRRAHRAGSVGKSLVKSLGFGSNWKAWFVVPHKRDPAKALEPELSNFSPPLSGEHDTFAS